VREGVAPELDALPDRVYEAFEKSATPGKQLDRDEIVAAARSFYEIMGWDPTTGVPRPGKLRELGLDWVEPLLTSRKT